MQCFGITKKNKRCNNKCKFLFCKTHVYQLFKIIISIIGAITFSIVSMKIYDIFYDNNKKIITLKTIQIDIPLFLFNLKKSDGSICYVLDNSGVLLEITDTNIEKPIYETTRYEGVTPYNIINQFKEYYVNDSISISCLLFTPGYKSLYHKIKVIEDECFVSNEKVLLKIEIISPLDISIHKSNIYISNIFDLDELKNNYYVYNYDNDINRIYLKNSPYFIIFNSSYVYRYCLDRVVLKQPILNYHYAGYE